MRVNGYKPAAWIRGRHLETIVPYFFPAPSVPGRAESRIVRVAREASLRLEVAWPDGRPRGTLLLIHGIGGSADSSYMRRTAHLAVSSGLVAVRMNLRNCGGSESLSTTLYNAGQSEDAARVLEHLDAERFPRPIGAAGFSMGANLLLRHAGKEGSACPADTIVAVNPPVDLDACLCALERPENRLYHVYFTVRSCSQIRRIRRVRPVPGPEARASRIGSLRRFDGLFTAPDAGYPSAEAYYADASAGPYLSRISVATLVLSAANDPFIPLETFEQYRAARLDRVRFEHPAQGGHVGYWQTGHPRFWAAEVIVDALGAANG